MKWNVTANEMIGTVISEFIGVILLAYTFPLSITAIMTATTTGWGSTIWGIWQILPIFVVVAALILIIAPIVYIVHQAIS